jgi:dihydrofolate synthase / folylpolyglutamate synthase
VHIADAEKYLLALSPGKIDFDLARLKRVIAGLGLDPLPFPAVLIGGTNGKGSVVTFTEALLAPHVRIGAFVKPHVFRITERVRIGGQPAPDEAFCGAVQQLADHLARADVSVTFFEATLLTALIAFRDAGVQLALIEVGLGGRFDAANALPRVLTAITSIGRDHEKFLGATLAGIAVEKAGIMAPGVPCIISRGVRSENPDCAEILRKLAALKHAPIVEPRVCASRLYGDLLPPQQTFALTGCELRLRMWLQITVNQLGPYQAHNLECAIAIAAELAGREYVPLPLQIPSSFNADYRGRFEPHRVGTGIIILDASHNEEGMRALARTLREYLPDAKPLLVFGCQEGKDVPRLLSPLQGLVSGVVPIELPILHPMPEADVVQGAQAAGFAVLHAGAPFAEKMAQVRAEAENGSRVLVSGSIYYLGTIAQALGLGETSIAGLNQ